MRKLNLLPAFLLAILGGCQPGQPDSTAGAWDEIGYALTGEIKPGIPVYGDTAIHYNRDGQGVLTVTLGKPVVVGVASKPEEWGFFQFPDLYRATDNKTLVANWNMAADAVDSYGKGGHGSALSSDGGQSWQPASGEETTGGGLLLPNGERISIYTPPALKVSDLKLPPPLASVKEAYGRTFSYYKLTTLPANLQGVYLNRMKKGETQWTKEQAVLEDSMAVRYTDSGMFPVVWWGDMHVLADGSVMAGIYPGFCIGQDGKVAPSGVFFYRSTDQGHSWKLQGRIPYQADTLADPNGAKRLALGFTEPAFEVLSDGTFLCVLRTTDGLGNSPMYLSRSTDQGKTWTKPKAFTRNGVLPQLLQLKNGVVVLASGRPGMQLRFSFGDQGDRWTDPFEMLPYAGEKEAVSCGYPDLLATGPDSFLLIYSDFKYQTADHETRKAIKVRAIKVTPDTKA